MDNKLAEHKKIWQEKKILREIYAEWYKQIIVDLKPSEKRSLEIGSGTGNLKEYKPDIITSDIDECSWLDMCFDAQRIPFDDGSLPNIVLVDVLHHLADPLKFLNEACRVLEKGGRLIFVEPYPSFFSKIVYRIFHPEPFIYNIDLFSQKPKSDKNPWDSNQAIPFILFFRDIDKFNVLFKNNFKIIKREKMSFLLYPLSGGFENRSLLPNLLIPFMRRVEKLLYPLRDLLSFRCYIVIEKI